MTVVIMRICIKEMRDAGKSVYVCKSHAAANNIDWQIQMQRIRIRDRRIGNDDLIFLVFCHVAFVPRGEIPTV